MLLRDLVHDLRGFLQDRRGGVAPMFALAIIPVIGLIGAAVDYSRANSIRTGMQAALDATALAMAKLAPTLTQTQLQTTDERLFHRRCSTARRRRTSSITPTYTTTGGSQLDHHGVRPASTPTFMQRDGLSRASTSAASSTVKWGNTRLRVALVLDNTGSMADDGKIDALKTATNNLLDSAQERRDQQRRRLCVDHSVLQGRQCRSRATTARAGSTGPTGTTTNGTLQQHRTGRSNDQSGRASNAGRHLDAGRTTTPGTAA